MAAPSGLSDHPSLFKEYAVVDLSRAGGADGRIGVRWRSEAEVIRGVGQVTCGETHCHDGGRGQGRAATHTFELPFSYAEGSPPIVTRVLVKVRLCDACSARLLAVRRLGAGAPREVPASSGASDARGAREIADRRAHVRDRERERGERREPHRARARGGDDGHEPTRRHRSSRHRRRSRSRSRSRSRHQDSSSVSSRSSDHEGTRAPRSRFDRSAERRQVGGREHSPPATSAA